MKPKGFGKLKRRRRSRSRLYRVTPCHSLERLRVKGKL